jgi:hypothetical protein
MPIDPQTLDVLLKTGVQATSTIAGQRAASGKREARQERIAACGRKPLLGKRKKAEYNKCVAELNNANTKSAPSDTYVPPPMEESGSNMKFVYIGIGILVLAGIGFFVIKKMNK